MEKNTKKQTKRTTNILEPYQKLQHYAFVVHAFVDFIQGSWRRISIHAVKQPKIFLEDLLIIRVS